MSKKSDSPEPGYCYCGSRLPTYCFKQMEIQKDSRYTHHCLCGRVYRYHAPEGRVMHVDKDCAPAGANLYMLH